jgi:hypothetical protein
LVIIAIDPYAQCDLSIPSSLLSGGHPRSEQTQRFESPPRHTNSDVAGVAEMIEREKALV